MNAQHELFNIVKDGYNMKLIDWDENNAIISIGGSERELNLKSSVSVSNQIDKYRKELGCTGLTEIDKNKIDQLKF